MDLPVGISTLQHTDRWVGGPLCAILTAFRKIFESAARPRPRDVERILFVKFAEQGSTVLAYPAILRAVEMVGRENVIAGSDCGIGSRVGHPQVGWAKFQAMAEGARIASRELWGG